MESTAWNGAASEKLDNESAQADSSALQARLAVENQAGWAGLKADNSTGSKADIQVAIVHLELCDSLNADANSSREPCHDLSFSLKPIKNIVLHQGEPGEAAQNLSVGGQIKKTDGKIELDFPNDDKVSVDTKTGNVDVDSKDKYQKEVHFEGTPWQRTVITSNNDTRITIGPKNISSIEHDGMMEIFPKSYSMQVGAEPRMPASEDLQRKLAEKGRGDLGNELSRIDKTEGLAHDAFLKAHGDKTSVSALSQTIKDRGVFLEKAAQALPDDAKRLDACAENQLRTALRNMREQFGTGTSETKPYAEALLDLLKSKGNSDQAEEIDRLAFEAKRGGLMKDVVGNIEQCPGATYQTMPREQAIAVRKSLISVHIAGGDSALKSFVSDVNKRLDDTTLVAPVGQDGPFHHGAIILTPEGATIYNGSFNLIPRRKKLGTAIACALKFS